MTAFAGFRLLGFPLTDTELLRSWSGKRVLLTYGHLTADEQVEAAQTRQAFAQPQLVVSRHSGRRAAAGV